MSRSPSGSRLLQSLRNRAGGEPVGRSSIPFGSYFVIWILMYLSLSVSWWLTVPLAILAGGLLIRVFIIFHDCGHGSFFKSRRANNFWGFVTGMLTFTPFYHWRWEHSVHHANHRGFGSPRDRRYLDLNGARNTLKPPGGRRLRTGWPATPSSFLSSPRSFSFSCGERFPSSKANPRERRSVWIMNLALLSMAAVLIGVYGFVPWLIIQLTVVAIAGSGGVWLFYVGNISSKTHTGSAGKTGTTLRQRCKAARFINCPGYCSGFPGTLGSIIFIISAPEFQTTIWRNATIPTPCFRR